MNPQEPFVPDPNAPAQDPGAPVGDPANPDQPTEYDAAGGDPRTGAAGTPGDDLSGYDEADADSFPASDPPAASEPGV